jgi:lipopolysaccharide heptosyltransferase II
LLNPKGLGEKKPVAAINPVAKWDTKLWEIRRFSKLADRLVAEYDFRIVFSGAKQDRALIQAIIEGMENRSVAVNLAGETTLKSLAAVYERARILVTTDTGPMHLAAALNTPVVAIFGPTAFWRTGPFGAGHLVITAGVDCAPCFKRTCKHKNCMKNIQVEDVWEGIQMMLEERHKSG